MIESRLDGWRQQLGDIPGERQQRQVQQMCDHDRGAGQQCAGKPRPLNVQQPHRVEGGHQHQKIHAAKGCSHGQRPIRQSRGPAAKVGAHGLRSQPDGGNGCQRQAINGQCQRRIGTQQQNTPCDAHVARGQQCQDDDHRQRFLQRHRRRDPGQRQHDASTRHRRPAPPRPCHQPGRTQHQPCQGDPQWLGNAPHRPGRRPCGGDPRARRAGQRG